VVIENRVHPSLPFGSLLNQGVTTAHPGTQVKQVRWRDPRFWEPSDQQKLSQVPGVSPIGLRALLTTFQGAGLGRFGEVNISTDLLELLNNKAPAGRCLKRNLEICTVEAGQELPDASPVCWRDPRARDLSRGRVEPFGRDLGPVLSMPITSVISHPPQRQPRHDPRAVPQPRAQGISYRDPRSVPPVRLAGRVAATTRAFLRRSTRRAGHLHRPSRHQAHDIFRCARHPEPLGLAYGGRRAEPASL